MREPTSVPHRAAIFHTGPDLRTLGTPGGPPKVPPKVPPLSSIPGDTPEMPRAPHNAHDPSVCNLL